MQSAWKKPVVIPETGQVVTSTIEARQFLLYQWQTLPKPNRSAVYRKILAAEFGHGTDEAVRTAFVALVIAAKKWD